MKFSKKKNSSGKALKAYNIFTFIIVFVIFLAVLGGIVVWAYLMINKEAPEDESSSSGLVSVKYEKKDNINILFTLVDSSKKQAERTVHGFLVLGIHPSTEKIVITSFPPETMVDEPLNEIRMSSLYQKDGTDSVKIAFESLTNSPIHSSVEMSLSAVEKIVKYYSEGIVFNIPEKLDFNGSPPIKMNEGEQTLSGSQVADVLRYPVASWSGGTEMKSRVFAEIMSNFTEKYFNQIRIARADTDYAEVIDMVTSDISIANFHEIKPLLELLVKSEKYACEIVTPQGDFSGSKEDLKFHLSETFTTDYSKIFGEINNNQS